MSVKDSFHLILEKISRTNFLVLAGLRHSIPHCLRSSSYNAAIGPLQLILEDNIFNVSKKKSTDYYKVLVWRKAQFPKSINKFQNNFNLSLQQLTQIFQLPHTVALEPYVRAFQWKVLNDILYTNSKLYQIGYIASDLCSLRTRASESLYHRLYFCPFSKTFWSDFESFWHLLTNEKIQLSLQDIIVGVVTAKCPSRQLLNYIICFSLVKFICGSVEQTRHRQRYMVLKKWLWENELLALTVKKIASLQENSLYVLRILFEVGNFFFFFFLWLPA